jgi:cytochrome oxidase Cu insertion factor (SCO1/SenC/PrrC family)
MEISDISDVIEDNNEDDHEESGDQAQKSPTHEEQKKQKKNQLNNYVAITVVLFVTFMGVCKVKSDNVVQAMQKAQADRIDTWAFYQARNMRAEVAKSTIAQLKLQVQTLQVQPQPQPKLLAAYGQEIAKYEAIAAKQDKEKDTLQQQAIDAEKLYEQLNVHDDQFDLSEAAFALAIALLAMTSLTQKSWLYGAAMVPAAFGLFMGLAGLLNWDYHPEALTKMLSENTIHQKHQPISTSPQPQPKI